MRTSGLLFLVAVLGWPIPSIAGNCDTGGPNCCSNCGGHAACVQKTCQLVCEIKKEKKYCFTVECEEFCTLLPGKRACCGECCDNCKGNCCKHCCKTNPPPKCGQQKCVKKLVKKEYEVEKPVYKCVVVYLCPACAGGESSIPEAAPVPSAPSVPQEAPAPPAPLPPTPKPKK